MPDNSPSPTISTDEGTSYINDALIDVRDNGRIYRFYLPGEDHTNADADWLEENEENLPLPAAVLIPLDVWGEFLQLREEATQPRVDAPTTAFNAAHTSMQLEQMALQTEELKQRSRIISVELAMQAIEQTPNKITATNLTEMADHIHNYLVSGKLAPIGTP